MILRLAAILALLAGTALAREERGAAPGDFDFYVLALSWSPAFCELEGGDRDREQCRPGRRLGFVVHGLWPQSERGYPSYCGADRFVPRAVLSEAEGLYPSEGLARYQWRKHGTCAGTSPSGYFRDVRRAYEALRIPNELADGSAQRLPPLAIERAFGRENPGLRPDMMSVACRRGVLQEVRICIEKDLRGFRSCPEVDRAGCRISDIDIPSPR
ncbi:MAG TPA: ribonuclease T2 [Beijerinckiaceae bacterium]